MRPFESLSPSEQISLLMRRTYEQGMTTTSGGNLSIRDPRGNIWISPSGIDKGTLRAADVVCVKPDGAAIGPHKPSVEYPFHKAIYDARPDVNALLHAHPADLVAFSVVRKIPDTHIIPQAQAICGRVGYAPYAIPGSSELGDNISACYRQGFDCVMLENHGVVCAGQDLLHAYHRFETLDFCARLHIHASRLGKVRVLSDEQLRLAHHDKNQLPELSPATPAADEQAMRQLICEFVHRSYDQHIMASTEGTLSCRLGPDAFLITPNGVDRRYLRADEIVRVAGGRRESGKLPSRAVVLHRTIYTEHPEISAILTAQPPHAMAFGVTDTLLPIRTIPESYFVLRDLPKIPFGPQYTDERQISKMLGRNCPVVMIENDAVLAVGATILQAFDRMEVAEFTARSVLRAMSLGPLVQISDTQAEAIRKAFF